MTLHIHKNILNQEKYDQEYINRELIAKSNTNDLPIFFFSQFYLQIDGMRETATTRLTLCRR